MPKNKQPVVQDEYCACNHSIYQHVDKIILLEYPQPIREPHHGRCSVIGCNCTQFTWQGFTTPEGKAS